MIKNFAHRGFSGKYPENTMLAFKKAIEAGCDGIEMDVHLTADGELVIIHDEKLERTTNGTGFVKDCTLAALQKLDASAAYSGVYGVNRIPTLREYFELVKDTGILTNIEIKSGIFEYTGIEDKVIAMIDEYHLRDKIILSSFNHYTVLRCKEKAPDIKNAFLEESWIIGMGEYTQKHGINCVHPIFRNLKPELFREMKEHGLRVNTWTVNENEDIRAMIALGVDGIISNYPDRVKQILGR